MRRSLLLASVAAAAFVAMPAGAFVGAAYAQESTGLEWADARIKWQGEVAQLSIRIRDYRLSPRYCRRPHMKDKTFDEVGLSQLEEELAILTGEFGRIQAGTRAATQGTSGAGLTTDRLMTRSYPKYRDKEVTDDRHWVLLRRDYIGDAQELLRKKKKALADAPEDYCGPPTPPKKEIEVIGGNPPVQPPPPPPPPPPVPVDPLKGLTRPTFEAINIPLLADRYCSQAEKDAALAKIAREIAKAEAQIAAIDAYIAAVGVRRAELEKRDVEAHWLSSMDYEVRQAERMRDDRRTVIESLNTTRKLIEQTPVVDCASGKEIGALPGWSAGIEAAYGDLTIPKKPYLSIEFGGNQYLGVVDHKREESIASILLSLTHEFDCDRMPNFRIGDPRNQRWMTSAELFGHDYSVFSSGGSIDTTTEGVGIPGTGDPMANFPAGVFLALPAFNDVTDLGYSHKSELDGISLGFGQKSYYNGWTSIVGIGASYTRLETSDNLSGSVPGYGIDFRYATDVETTNFTIFMKGRAEIAMDDFWETSLRYAGEFSGFRLALEAQAGANFLDADGTDRLDLVGGANDAQRVALAKEDTTFGYKLGAFLEYVPPGAETLELSIGARYGESDTHPVANRSGQTGERTQIEFETQEEVVGTLGTRFRF